MFFVALNVIRKFVIGNVLDFVEPCLTPLFQVINFRDELWKPKSREQPKLKLSSYSGVHWIAIWSSDGLPWQRIGRRIEGSQIRMPHRTKVFLTFLAEFLC